MTRMQVTLGSMAAVTFLLCPKETTVKDKCASRPSILYRRLCLLFKEGQITSA